MSKSELVQNSASGVDMFVVTKLAHGRNILTSIKRICNM